MKLKKLIIKAIKWVIMKWIVIQKVRICKKVNFKNI